MPSISSVNKKYLQNLVKEVMGLPSIVDDDAPGGMAPSRVATEFAAEFKRIRKEVENQLEILRKDAYSIPGDTLYVLENSFGQPGCPGGFSTGLEDLSGGTPGEGPQFFLKPPKKLKNVHEKLKKLTISPENKKSENIGNIWKGISIFIESFPDEFNALRRLGTDFQLTPSAERRKYATYFYINVLREEYRGNMSQAILKILNLRENKEKSDLLDFYNSSFEEVRPEDFKKYLKYKLLKDKTLREDITGYISYGGLAAIMLHPGLRAAGLVVGVVTISLLEGFVNLLYESKTGFMVEVNPKSLFREIEKWLKVLENQKKLEHGPNAVIINKIETIINKIENKFLDLNKVIVNDWNKDFGGGVKSTDRINYDQAELLKNNPGQAVIFYRDRLENYKIFFRETNQIKRKIKVCLTKDKPYRGPTQGQKKQKPLKLNEQGSDDEFSMQSERFAILEKIAELIGKPGIENEMGRASSNFSRKVYPFLESPREADQLETDVTYLWQRGASIKHSSMSARQKNNDAIQDLATSSGLDNLMKKGWLGHIQLHLFHLDKSDKYELLCLGFLKAPGNKAIPVFYKSGVTVANQGAALAKAIKYGTIHSGGPGFRPNYPEVLDLVEYIQKAKGKIDKIDEIKRDPGWKKVKSSTDDYDQKFIVKYTIFLFQYQTVLKELKTQLKKMNKLRRNPGRGDAHKELKKTNEIFGILRTWFYILERL